MRNVLLRGLQLAIGTALTVCLITVAVPDAEAAGVRTIDGDKWVEVGGHIQMQYHRVDPDQGDETDELLFRRLRPYIEGSFYPDWRGRIQFEFDKAKDENEMSLLDVYVAYEGFEQVTLLAGNAFTPFSREQLTSSKRQQLVERTFVGDRNYGVPGRNLGLHASGGLVEKKIGWAVSAVQSSIDPDTDVLDFDTQINTNSDFNEGWLFGGRLDFHPLGYMSFAQGDFKKEPRATISLAAFTWNNDDDNNTYTDPATGLTSNPGDDQQDVDAVTGFEVSGAIRGYGISIDAEYNRFDSELADDTLTTGLYEDGETTLETLAIEGGYMFPNNRFELVAGYQVLDADNYDEQWTRTSVGANYFFTRNYDVELQVTYRIGENLNGVDGNDADEIFVQMQYIF